MPTYEALNVQITSFKRTKIIATLGPATASYELIYQVIKAGANGLRFNFSHGTHEERLVQIPWIRKASRELGKPVAIIQDLQGPKIRLGDFDEVIPVQAGQHLSFQYCASYAESGHIPIQYDLTKKVKAGQRLYLFDGRVRTVITSVRQGVVYATAENEGILIKRKGINLPDTDLGGDILTDKDMADIAFGATQDFDYVALSFVQTAHDVERVRKILKAHNSTAKIIVKLETKAGVDNIEDIVEATDMIMIARGDLAVETPAESVPVVQRQIISLGQKYGKPTIVATQMLLSMVDMPEPTRAEVSDVATAVFVGADCVMLSDETAMGKYPIETVSTMKRIILSAEQHPPFKVVYSNEREHTIQHAISNSAISLAKEIEARAIIATTKSGATALAIACRRPETPIIAVTDEARVAQQLTLAYGVKSFIRPVVRDPSQRFTDWLREKKLLQRGDAVVTVSGSHSGVVGATDTIKIRMLE